MPNDWIVTMQVNLVFHDDFSLVAIIDMIWLFKTLAPSTSQKKGDRSDRSDTYSSPESFAWALTTPIIDDCHAEACTKQPPMDMPATPAG